MRRNGHFPTYDPGVVRTDSSLTLHLKSQSVISNRVFEQAQGLQASRSQCATLNAVHEPASRPGQPIPAPRPDALAPLIIVIRGERVMLSDDLAALYGVPTKALAQAYRRNLDRFPPDFAFQLTREETQALQALRSQSVTLKRGQHIKHLPFAFTEQGVAMLSSVLRSPRAVEVNIAIVRTFVQLRRLMDTNRDLAARIDALEARYDEQFAQVFEAIRQLIAEDGDDDAERATRRIGFTS